MSTSRRSSRSTRSTATRSARPSAWRSGPTAPALISKNASAPEVTAVIAEPEVFGVSSSGASTSVTLSNTLSTPRSGHTKKDARPAAQRKSSTMSTRTRTRVQDVFRDEDFLEGSTSNTTLSSTNDPEVYTQYAPPPLSSSPSPSQKSWFGSLSRRNGKGKNKVVEVDVDSQPSNSVQDTEDTPKPPALSIHADESKALNSAIEALDATEAEAKTIRPNAPSKHTWFNPFAPYPSPSQSQPFPSTSTNSAPASAPVSTSASPTAASPLSRASSSQIGSVDDEVPSLVQTPTTHSDDEENAKTQTLHPNHMHVTSTLSPNPVTDDNASGIITVASTSSEGGQDPTTSTLRPRKRLDSINSLNPSTSRFSINVSLLGRPKIKLEDTVKQADDALPPVVSSITVDQTPAPLTMSDSEDPVSDEAAATQEPLPPVPPVSIEIQQSESDVTPTDATTQPTHQQEASSWWSYVGWGSSQPQTNSLTQTQQTETTTQSSASLQDDTPTPKLLPNPIMLPVPPTDPLQDRSTSAPPVLDSEHARALPPTTTTAESNPSEAEVNPQASTVDAPPVEPTDASAPSSLQLQSQTKAPSVFSLDTARAAGSWLNPWAWYGYNSSSAASAPEIASSADDVGGSGGTTGNENGLNGNGDRNDNEAKKELTESEKVKEAALARDRQSPQTEPQQQEADLHDSSVSPEAEAVKSTSQIPSIASPSSPEPLNPIADSVSTHRLGWASFFSLSRGTAKDLITKNISAEAEEETEEEIRRDENGVEIMDITDDEGEAGNVGIEVQESELEKAVVTSSSAKVPTSTALNLIRALAGGGTQDKSNTKMIEDAKDSKEKDKDEKNQANDGILSPASPPSPNPSIKSAPVGSTDSVLSNVPHSPTKSKALAMSTRHGRTTSVSTTRTNTSSKTSVSNKPAPPLTISDDLKASVAAAKRKRISASPAPSSRLGVSSSLPKDGISRPTGFSSGKEDQRKDFKDAKAKAGSSKSGTTTPIPRPPPPPNLVLPTWEDTFHTAPRNWVPDQYLPASPSSISPGTSGGIGSTIGKTMRYMSGVLLGSSVTGADSGYVSSGEGSGSRSGAGASLTRRRSRRGSSTRRRSISQSADNSAIPDGGLRAGVVSEAELVARERERLKELINWGKNLPRAWDVIDHASEARSNQRISTLASKGKSRAQAAEESNPNLPSRSTSTPRKDVTRGCEKVVIIGIHGWFPGAIMRSMLGEFAGLYIKDVIPKLQSQLHLMPTGTSPKFVNMMEQALNEFQSKHGLHFDKITKIPLEGEGTIEKRVEKLYGTLLANESWMDDLHNADVIFVATHSQGSVVSTHLLDRLIRERHIRTAKNGLSEPITGLGINIVPPPPQRVCCLCLCGIHLGPLRYLSTSSLVQPYIQYFESTAARELFEFQNTESEVSKAYVQALRNVVDNETKMVYVASLNDQVVPIYSGLFTSASHPLILRALYVDGDAYSSSDFLTNLLVLLLRILNCGLSDSGLLAHLSEVTSGALSGTGHSTPYEELATFALAVNYLFLTNTGFEDHPTLMVEPFNASNEMNDYEIPWALRDLIADEKVAHYFSQEITQLRDAFRDWHPKSTPLRDIKRKLQPIQRLPTTSTPGTANSASKL